ncbi:MAG TPA: right-handed parallel beta-helix repeat-containing protein, partial [Bryobacteraceae bacterium]|nr:right-handed parallel beta-helix repeat-containing protein [Bryobacteraceae bacterium]
AEVRVSWQRDDAAAVDTTSPSPPDGLVAQATSPSEVKLAWSAGTDDVGVTGYRVYRDGAAIATTVSTSHSVTGLSAGIAYSFAVSALDAAGNLSPQTARVSASTPLPNLSIQSFGARCDGTSNDAPAVQAAIDALPQNGGVVSLPCMAAIGPPGILVSNRANVTIRGSAPGAGFKAYTNTGTWSFGRPVLLVLRGCGNCTVGDLLFEGNNVSVGMLRIERSAGNTIENNVIRNTGMTNTAALTGMGGRNNRYLRNTIDTTAGDMRGMWIGNPGNELEYNPVVSYNTVRNIAATGIVGGQVSGGTFSHNVVEKCNGSGMKIEPLPGDTETVVIENNRLMSNLWAGITIGGPPASVTRVSVRNNHAESNRTGISLDAKATGDVTGNIIFNNNRGMPQGWLGGLYIVHAKDLVVQRNLFYDTNPPDSPLRQDQGIMINPSLRDGVTNVLIRNNTFENHLMDGINVQSKSEATISGLAINYNAFTSNSRAGINIMESLTNTILKVEVFNNCFVRNRRNVIDTRANSLVQPPSFESCNGFTQ